MKEKTSVFGSSGQQDSTKRNETAFRTAMQPNTIAYAEDVNTFGNMADEYVFILCQEIVNALRQQGIEPDALDNTQVANMINTTIAGAYALTGLTNDAVTTPVVGNTITFSGTIIYNEDVYYGNTQSRLTKVSYDAVTLSVDSNWTPGVNYIYATKTGSLGYQTTPILGSEGATKCMLGSLFVIKDENDNYILQENSFAFNPWLPSTSRETRESPTALTKGGYMQPVSGLTVEMGTLEVRAEGINYGLTGSGKYLPDIITFPDGNYTDFPYLYPDYISTGSRATGIDTTHIYSMTNEEYAELDEPYYGMFMVQVPCVAPTGQRMMIPAMSNEDSGVFDQLFPTMEAAEAAIFGLHYTSTETDHTRARAIYVGQSIIVKVGATDLTNGENFKTVGIVPQELAGFTSSAGQTGGAVGDYVPMREVTFNGTAATLLNFASNVIVGSTSAPVAITFPTPTEGRLNSLIVKYIAVNSDNETTLQGLSFPGTTRWWTTAPVFAEGCTYMFAFDYINGYWYGSYQAFQQTETAVNS